jgi:hypothetical protein
MEAQEPLAIGYAICDESREITKLLVIGYRVNGSVFTMDTGLTADEAKQMIDGFRSWIDQCLGREIARITDPPA